MSNDIKNNRVLCNWCNKEFERFEEYVLFGALNYRRTIRVGGVLLCTYCTDEFMRNGVTQLIEKCNGQ